MRQRTMASAVEEMESATEVTDRSDGETRHHSPAQLFTQLPMKIVMVMAMATATATNQRSTLFALNMANV